MANHSGNVSSPVAFTYIAVGSGTTAFNATQTALVTEITGAGLARTTGTCSQVTTTVADDTMQNTKAFSVTASATIGEVGLFNASSAGDMLCRTVLSPTRTVGNGDTYTPVYKVTFA